MTTTYLSNKAASTVSPKYTASNSIPVYANASLTAALVANDLVQMMTIPAGATICSVVLDCDKLDSNGTPTIKFDVGDATTANRFLAASTVGQAGGAAVANVAAAYGYQYTANTPLYVKCNTAAATWQNGTVRLLVEYTMDP